MFCAPSVRGLWVSCGCGAMPSVSASRGFRNLFWVTRQHLRSSVRIPRKPQDQHKSCVTRRNVSNRPARSVRPWVPSGNGTDFGKPGASRELISSEASEKAGPGHLPQITWGISLNTGCHTCPVASFCASAVRPPRPHLPLLGGQSGSKAWDPLLDVFSRQLNAHTPLGDRCVFL